VIAIVLIAALVMGTEEERGEDNATHSNPSHALDAPSDDRESSARLCDPDRTYIKQRDLTLPLDQQSSDDDH